MKRITEDLVMIACDMNQVAGLMCADVDFEYRGEYRASARYYRRGNGYQYLETELPTAVHNEITEEVEANEAAIHAFLEKQFQIEEAGEITNMQSI